MFEVTAYCKKILRKLYQKNENGVFLFFSWQTYYEIFSEKIQNFHEEF